MNRLGNEKASKTARNTRLEKMILGQYKAAAEGSAQAAQLILHYIAGKPKETLEVNVGPSEMMVQLLRMVGQGKFDGLGDEIDALVIEHKPDEE